MKRSHLHVCVLSIGLSDDPERIAETRASLVPVPALEVTIAVVPEVRAAALAFAASGADALLVLRAGERLEPAAMAVLAAFAADGEAGAQHASGQVRLLELRGETIRRRIEPRLFRAGAAIEGGLTPWSTGPRIDVGACIAASVSAPAARGVRTIWLALSLASTPDDARLHLELAELLLDVDPATAVALANRALEGNDVDGPEGPRLALALGEALFATGALEETLGLVEACGSRWPTFTELAFLAFRANRALGRLEETKASLLRCLAIGVDDRFPGTLGAGTYVAAYELGLWFEAANDRASAAASYTAAAAHHPPAEQRRLALTSAREGHAPARLAEAGDVATKLTRYGTMSYLVRDAFAGRALDLYGEWRASEIDLLVRFLGEGDVVVDVGANIGGHTVPLAKAVGARGCVVAVEPQRTAHALLSANAIMNGLLHVECLRAAAGSAAGTVRIPALDPRAPCDVGAAEVIADEARTEGEEVPCLTIDDLGLTACRLIKIDAEGFEVEVLDGAQVTIARHRPILFVENDTVGRSAACLRAIRALGYRAYWHVARYYRPDNFFASDRDVFADCQPHASVVCVPQEQPASALVQGLVSVVGEDDDFLKAIARGALAATLASTPVAAVAPAPKSATIVALPRPRPLTVVACIPGREFSGLFFDAWNEFAERCRDAGIKLVISRTYDAVVYYARNKVAGGDTRRGLRQVPWDGAVDYDYMLWIDSDVLFRFEDFLALLKHQVAIAGGVYLMADGQRFAAVETMDAEAFRATGHFEFLTPAALARRDGLVQVDYCGFGFVLIRAGVFEKLEYPWFRPVWIDMPGGVREFTSEDVGFCIEARKAGFPIHVDPRVIVGHEKSTVLKPLAPLRAA